MRCFQDGDVATICMCMEWILPWGRGDTSLLVEKPEVGQRGQGAGQKW
jgi:hypothetical protein